MAVQKEAESLFGSYGVEKNLPSQLLYFRLK